MVLTATTTTVLRPGPSWDETIVPALRKRLESESRTLSRRMSAISTTSADTPSPSYTDTNTPERDPTPSTPHPLKGSAIPRPSFQQTRSSTDTRSTPNGSPLINGTTSPDTRSRTNSHPYTFDTSNGSSPVKPHTNGVPVSPPPEHPHATSSYSARSTDAKPTRIPKATTLARTASLSSQRHLPSPTINSFLIDGRNGYGSPVHEPSLDHHHHHLYHQPVAETSHSNNSRSAISPGSQHSRLLQEPPPFQSDSMSTASHDLSQEDDAPGRHSNDSEERPFEHWYRGEVSRNGGVGELRVGKRQEMLDIANYGHSLRKITPRNAPPRGLPPVDDTPRRRKRADSVAGIGDRESFYMDEERAKEVARVLDEGPLTDLDVDEDSDYSMSIRHEAVAAQARLGRETPTNSHTPARQQSLPPSRIPAPKATRQSSEPPRMPTPPIPQRFASEPPSLPSTSTPQAQATSAMPRSASQPQGPDQTAKRRAKSPMTPPSASKRSKATALSIASRRAAEDDKNRRSVAYYPTPEDGVDMVNAIPSWTQPVPALGGWDEVVLPVVARKKGLEGQYEKAHGTSQPIRTRNVVEPAPGTFGINHSKYRTPPGDEISMDEFGITEEGEKGYRPQDEMRLPARNADRTSSPPFSHYRPKEKLDENDPPVTDPPNAHSEMRQALEKDDGAGCCKCIIM